MRKSRHYRPPREKEKERYYLLPGMGGRAYRSKQRVMVKAALVVGLIVSALFALIAYFIYRNPL